LIGGREYEDWNIVQKSDKLLAYLRSRMADSNVAVSEESD